MNTMNEKPPIPAHRRKIDVEKYLARAALLKKDYQEEQEPPCHCHANVAYGITPMEEINNTHCVHCKDHEKPQEAQDEEKLDILLKLMPDGGALVMQLIRSNFISKQALRKLLEGKKKNLARFDDDDEKELYDDAWRYNLILDDIKAEIDKL
jgi:hypothetical protein